jgi:2-dehydro-3-deoxyphosphogluconate aldolase / (4S)-4-hydroxy-2-oxoglutarate aldolase
MMNPLTRSEIVGAIEASGVVAVVRLDDAQVGLDVARAIAAGGVMAIEVTMTVPNAVRLIEELAASLPDAVLVGAGTVVDAKTARAVIRAGARFVVGPVFRPDVIAECHRHDVPAMPGGFSPTEILNAYEAGADVVKVFPATALGPGFIKDIRAPLPQLKLIPTGGVTRENAGDWIRAGAVAIGVGSALVDPKLVAKRQFEAITERARDFVAAVRDARAGSAEPKGSAPLAEKA